MSLNQSPDPVAQSIVFDMTQKLDIKRAGEVVDDIIAQLTKLGIPFWTVGQCRGRVYIFVRFQEDIADIQNIIGKCDVEILYCKI